MYKIWRIIKSFFTNKHEHGFLIEDLFKLGLDAKCTCGMTLKECNVEKELNQIK